MFRKRQYISLEETDKLLHRISLQKRQSYIQDRVSDNKFIIHKSIPNTRRDNWNAFVYKFVGSVHKKTEKCEIHYRVFPSISWIVTFALLCVVFLYALLNVLFMEGNVVFLMCIFLFLLVFFGIAEWECSECVKAFESKLK